MNPLVSIVVPTRNGAATLPMLLRAVEDQAAPFDRELLAIDSGSADGTLDILRDRGVDVVSVSAAAFNHGETRNLVLRRVRGEFAVLMVQDAVPAHPEWLNQLVTPLLEDPAVAGTFARQRPWPDASRLTVYYLEKWAAAAPSARVSPPVTPTAIASMSPGERHLACAFDNVCSCVRMSVWRKHQFRATPIAEDLEWALEVITSGHKLAYVPSAVVWHSHERSVRYEFYRTYRVHQRLQALFGLSTVPTVPALVRSLCATLPVHIRLAAAEPKRRARALVRGAGLAVAMPLGQYLGARSAREGRELIRPEGV